MFNPGASYPGSTYPGLAGNAPPSTTVSPIQTNPGLGVQAVTQLEMRVNQLLDSRPIPGAIVTLTPSSSLTPGLTKTTDMNGSAIFPVVSSSPYRWTATSPDGKASQNGDLVSATSGTSIKVVTLDWKGSGGLDLTQIYYFIIAVIIILVIIAAVYLKMG